MADEEVQSFKLDLDTEDFKKSANDAAETLNNIGNVADLAKIPLLLENVKIGIEAIKGAGELLYKVLEATFEAENIKAVNQEFETLTSNAGIAGDALKEGLEKASGGLIDETKLLEIANKAIVTMGDSAKDLPAIMEIARKSTAAFGGDLTQNFQNLTMAVSTGNTKMLKHMGIVVDSKKAMSDYASSIGVTVDSLSQAGKTQAVLNAVLEKGKTSFAGIDENVRESQNNWQRFKVAITELGEEISKLVAETLGPLANMLVKVGTSVVNAIKNISEWGRHQLELEFGIKKTYDAQKSLNDESEKIAKTTALKVDEAKVIQNQIKFEQDLLNLRRSTNTEELKRVQDVSKADQLLSDQRALNAKKFELDLKQIDSQITLGTMTVGQAELKKAELVKQYTQQQIQTRKEFYAAEKNALDNLVSESETAADAFVNAIKAATHKSEKDFSDFAAAGKKSVSEVESGFSSAFQAMGDGSKSASEAMKGFMLGALGSIAINYGEAMVMMGIGMENPLQIIEGGALIALGGLLKGLGGSGSPSPSGGSVSAGGAGTTAYAATANVAQQATQQQKQNTVTVNIQGHMFNTAQTRTAVMDIVRSATDQTDFKYVQIGST